MKEHWEQKLFESMANRPDDKDDCKDMGGE